jgi:exodeoxyribonuclease VIII
MYKGTGVTTVHSSGGRSVEGLIELSSFWMERETGLFCKSRQDKVCLWENELTIVDLKTTVDASPSGFRSQIYNYEYHVQAAFYCDAISDIEQANCTRFIFIAVEKEPPYVCGVYMLEPEAMSQGRETYFRYLKKTKECVAKDLWPGYSNNLEPITLPPFAFKPAY